MSTLAETVSVFLLSTAIDQVLAVALTTGEAHVKEEETGEAEVGGVSVRRAKRIGYS